VVGFSFDIVLHSTMIVLVLMDKSLFKPRQNRKGQRSFGEKGC